MAWPRDSRLDALPDLYSRRRPNIITASPPVGHVCEKVVWMSHKRLSQPNRIVQECRQKICILVFQRNDASAATGFSPAAHNGRTIHPAPDGRGAGGAGGGAKPIAPPGKPGGTRRPYIGARAYCPAPDGRGAGGAGGGAKRSPPSFAWLAEGASPHICPAPQSQPAREAPIGPPAFRRRHTTAERKAPRPYPGCQRTLPRRQRFRLTRASQSHISCGGQPRGPRWIRW